MQRVFSYALRKEAAFQWIGVHSNMVHVTFAKDTVHDFKMSKGICTLAGRMISFEGLNTILTVKRRNTMQAFLYGNEGFMAPFKETISKMFEQNSHMP
jgi:hypothetical protein